MNSVRALAAPGLSRGRAGSSGVAGHRGGRGLPGRPLCRPGHAVRPAARHGDELPERSRPLQGRDRLRVADRAAPGRRAARFPHHLGRDRRARLATRGAGHCSRDADHPRLDRRGAPMGFDPKFGLLSGGATAICGASAAMAISAALPHHPLKERATLFTIIGVSTLSTIAMMLYPAIAKLIGLDDLHAGIFIGATIHDVAQVVGAGYAISPEAGDTATVVKLMRVAMLLPVIVATGLVTVRRARARGRGRRSCPGFWPSSSALVAFNSLVPVPVVRAGRREYGLALVPGRRHRRARRQDTFQRDRRHRLEAGAADGPRDAVHRRASRSLPFGEAGYDVGWSDVTILFVPGLRDHVAEHWQTLLAAEIPGSVTVEPLTERPAKPESTRCRA